MSTKFTFSINLLNGIARPQISDAVAQPTARPLGGEGHSQNGEGGSSFTLRINSRSRLHAP